jgi:hypothetical protein
VIVAVGAVVGLGLGVAAGEYLGGGVSLGDALGVELGLGVLDDFGFAVSAGGGEKELDFFADNWLVRSSISLSFSATCSFKELSSSLIELLSSPENVSLLAFIIINEVDAKDIKKNVIKVNKYIPFLESLVFLVWRFCSRNS